MSFKDDTHRLRLTDYCFSKVNLEDYNVIYICKEQILGVNPRTIQQINFTVNQDQTGQAFMFFIYE